MRYGFVFPALLIATVAAAEPLSRREAVERALLVNPGVQKAIADLSALNGQKDEALADALPELKLFAGWNRYRDPSLLNSSSFDAFPPELRDSLRPAPANLNETSLQLRQTLFSFKIGAAIKAARLARKLGDEDVRRARQSVALEAVRAYNQYLLSLEKVKVAQKVVRYKERQLETAKNRYAAGVATVLEVLRSNVDLENQRTQLLTLSGESDLARASLNAVMLRPVGLAIEATDTLTFQPLELELDDVVAAAWRDRPEAQAIALSERIYGHLVDVARSEARPSLDFYGQWGYSVRQPRNFGDSDYTRWSAGITLAVPLFDGGRTRGKVAQARAQHDKTALDKQQLENQIRLEAQAALDALRVARSVLGAAELNLAQAQRALDMTDANARAGAATFLDVLDAQAALTQADSQRLFALYVHANARAAVRYVMAQDVLDLPSQAPTAPAVSLHPCLAPGGRGASPCDSVAVSQSVAAEEDRSQR